MVMLGSHDLDEAPKQDQMNCSSEDSIYNSIELIESSFSQYFQNSQKDYFGFQDRINDQLE